MKRNIRRTLMVGGAAALAVAVAARSSRASKVLRRGAQHLEGRARYAQGQVQGLRYRLQGRTPDPSVPDDVLADRIRSSLGPVTRRLDVPRVHVEVEERVAILHGSVGSTAEARVLERFVGEVAGVRGVESYLHVGFASGDTLPSEGRARAAAEPSQVLRELIAAAHRAGAREESAPLAVRAVLATFAARVPPDEREQLLSHVPADVRELATPPRRLGETVERWRTVDELVAAVEQRDVHDARHAEAITESVLGHLRELVPEEEDDVAATLPPDLRELWKSAVPG